MIFLYKDLENFPKCIVSLTAIDKFLHENDVIIYQKIEKLCQ